MIQAPQNSKSQRLAPAIVGSVSLCSYEAGVMYEIIEAIRQHNWKMFGYKRSDSFASFLDFVKSSSL